MKHIIFIAVLFLMFPVLVPASELQTAPNSGTVSLGRFFPRWRVLFKTPAPTTPALAIPKRTAGTGVPQAVTPQYHRPYTPYDYDSRPARKPYTPYSFSPYHQPYTPYDIRPSHQPYTPYGNHHSHEPYTPYGMP